MQLGVSVDAEEWTPAQFKALYQRHVAEVFRFAARRAGPAAAEEITAETFLEAWAHRGRYRPELGTELSWFRGIAANVVRHHHRGEQRRRRAYRAAAGQASPPSAGVDESRLVERADAAEAWPQTREVLASMRADEREVFVLFARNQLSYQAIAEQLDIPIGTVRSRLNRGRARALAALPASLRRRSS